MDVRPHSIKRKAAERQMAELQPPHCQVGNVKKQGRKFKSSQVVNLKEFVVSHNC